MPSITQPRTGTAWTIVVDNAIVRREAVTGDDDDVSATYTITHKGLPYLSGALEWDSDTTNIEGAWSKEFSLPPTPGVCVVTVTVSKDTAVGVLSQSIRVT